MNSKSYRTFFREYCNETTKFLIEYIQITNRWCGESTELKFWKFYNWEAALRDHSAYFTSSHSKDIGPEDSESDEYSDDLDDFEEFEEFDDSETESCDSDDEEDSDSDVPKFCEDSKFPGCFVESKDDCDFSVNLTQFQLTHFSDDPSLVFR